MSLASISQHHSATKAGHVLTKRPDYVLYIILSTTGFEMIGRRETNENSNGNIPADLLRIDASLSAETLETKIKDDCESLSRFWMFSV